MKDENKAELIANLEILEARAREWIKRGGWDELRFVQQSYKMLIESDDPAAQMVGKFAMLGINRLMLAAMEAGDLP